MAVELVSSTKIGNDFGISANKLNHLLSELGWVNKSLKGWVATEQGLKQGAIQSEDTRTGVPYVRWPETITQSSYLLSSINAVTDSDSSLTSLEVDDHLEEKYHATDGHYVNSKVKMLIDNWLYMAEIVHAYKRKLPIEENVYCDFYIPTGKVYIECWSNNNDPMYEARKQKKIAIYKQYGFKLIELNDSDVQNLDDILPRLLLKFGVQAY